MNANNELNINSGNAREFIESKLKLWGLSKETIKVLAEEPEIVDYLASKRYLPPFPEDYEAQIFEVRFDDLTYYYQEKGQPPYIRASSSDYTPAFTEYLIDEEILVFQVGSELVIDRSRNLNRDNFKIDNLWPKYKLSSKI
ncbi:MAG: hypothetical protein ACFBSE_11825 [Prochloraceae cyanobacterium]